MEQIITALLHNYWWLLLVALGVPTAVTGFLIRRFEKSLDKREAARQAEQAAQAKKAEEREKQREMLERNLIQSTTASMALGEAVARAVQRIPDAHCNGDMHAALEYATKVKHDQKDFLTALGIHALHDD